MCSSDLNIVPVIRTDALNDTVEATLNEVSAALTTDALSELMSRVVTEGEDPAAVARDFVDRELGG